MDDARSARGAGACCRLREISQAVILAKLLLSACLLSVTVPVFAAPAADPIAREMVRQAESAPWGQVLPESGGLFGVCRGREYSDTCNRSMEFRLHLYLARHSADRVLLRDADRDDDAAVSSSSAGGC